MNTTKIFLVPHIKVMCLIAIATLNIKLGTLNCFAQGNLQFNQVMLLPSATGAGGTLTYTVPAGKVWKIEGYNSDPGSSISCGSGGNITPVVTINGYVSNNTLILENLITPYWLGAGHTFAITSVNSACSGTVPRVVVSAIEFNIVP